MTNSILPHQADRDKFLDVASQFHLGSLVTEQPHPATRNLSALARENLPAAFDVLKQVDLEALTCLEQLAPKLAPLAEAMAQTLAAGKRIFFCGCGATGRLSISLEIFGREGFFGALPADALAGFMAGGDAALVRSIEVFEDFPSYGARQLQELGFQDGDLLVSTTEGGETPFVIGATEEAVRLSPSNSPFFLYCNPDDLLSAVAERSRRVIENPDIQKINLTVGPMAITGSTRMQASTVLMAAVGWALGGRADPSSIPQVASRFREFVEGIDYTGMVPFTERETAAYQNGEYLLYEPGRYGITVLTDTTERSPTFSLAPFENDQIPSDPPSLCYLHLADTDSSPEAWHKLLGREPRCLEWGGLDHLTGHDTMLGFDFSDAMVRRRKSLGRHLHFVICRESGTMRFSLDGDPEIEWRVPVQETDSFTRHLLLKLLLNSHSTLIMGLSGRFSGNVMTHVKPTNNKLIDRSIRYVRLLLEQQGVPRDQLPAYETVADALFRERLTLKPGEPIVLKTVEKLRNSNSLPH